MDELKLIEEKRLYRVPTGGIILLWIACGFFTLVPMLAIRTATSLAVFAPLFLGIFFGWMALRASLWRICLLRNEMEWRDFFATSKILSSEIEACDCEVRYGKTKHRRSGYVIVKLKSGKCLESPPLGTNDATTIARSVQDWLAGSV